VSVATTETLPEQETSRLWTIADVARFLRVSEATAYGYAKQGKLPEAKRIGQRRLFDPAAVKAMLGV
jgi:predicted DNA-binding transcriptional regulator AlpA